MLRSQAAAAEPQTLPPLKRLAAIVGGSAGNLVEWYDWFAYASFTIYFAKAFFPKGDQTTQWLQAAAVFAVGFLARPVGDHRHRWLALCGCELTFLRSARDIADLAGPFPIGESRPGIGAAQSLRRTRGDRPRDMVRFSRLRRPTHCRRQKDRQDRKAEPGERNSFHG